MHIDRAINLDDVRELARKRLPGLIFDFVEGGVDDEAGLVRNRTAFGRYRLLPRYLVDVSSVDRSTVLFGRRFGQPFGISPTGLADLSRRNADLMLAEAAARAKMPFLLSSASNASLESAVRAAGEHLWFQVYGTRDPAIAIDMVRRARDAGIATLVVSVDVPVHGNRERNRRSGFQRQLTLGAVMQTVRRPGWLWEYLRGGGLPIMRNWVPYAPPGASASQIFDLMEASCPAPAQTWNTLDDFRTLWPGTLIVKGVLHPADARRAKASGVDGVILSNHGGRQLDSAPSPLDALPGVRAAVGGEFPVMLDSGVRRGSDIVIARCLGADFVFFGRPTLYGAAAGGIRGIEKVIDLVGKEVDMVLAQIGCPAMDLLGPEYLAGAAS